MTWTNEVKRDGVLVSKVMVTRTGVYSGQTQTGCALEIEYTAVSAAQLNRIRLVYTPSSGPDVVLDDASEANNRIGSTSEKVVVSGTAPAGATAVKLLWTPDGGSESVVESTTFTY
jgi:hypothetical protein